MGDGHADVLVSVAALSEAFRTRNVRAALSCFAPDPISYVGSEHHESATGREAVARLFCALFSRPESYTWTVTSALVHPMGSYAYLLCDATGHARRDDGHGEDFPYRLSGILERHASAWLWRACHGCEPTVAPAP